MTGLLVRAFVAALALFAGLSQVSARELRLSHQWPESDARHKASRVLMAELRKRGTALTISLHPNSSLKIKPVEQYDALLEGKIELAVYPIAYQSAKIPGAVHRPAAGRAVERGDREPAQGHAVRGQAAADLRGEGLPRPDLVVGGRRGGEPGAGVHRSRQRQGTESARRRSGVRRHAGRRRRQHTDHAVERNPRGHGGRQARRRADLVRILHELPRHRAGQVRHARRQRHLGDVHAGHHLEGGLGQPERRRAPGARGSCQGLQHLLRGDPARSPGVGRRRPSPRPAPRCAS